MTVTIVVCYLLSLQFFVVVVRCSYGCSYKWEVVIEQLRVVVVVILFVSSVEVSLYKLYVFLMGRRGNNILWLFVVFAGTNY